MIRVLVVDDSRVARDLLVGVFAADPEFEVVGTAADGREAIERVAELEPDVVTMDVQMPVLDGYAATREIMTDHPTPIVVVSGSMSQPDVEKSMNSLASGALAVVGKPPSPTAAEFAAAAAHLRSLVKSMAAVKVVRRHRPRVETPRVASQPTSKPTNQPASAGVRTKLIGIAASTGGPGALLQVLGGLPPSFPIPIAVVQHIAEGFTRGFVDWLNGSIPLDVVTATNGGALEPGRVYVAPEGRHLGIGTGPRCELLERPAVDGFRPSATMMFETAARSLGTEFVGVVLTGMGRDGCDGLRSVRQCRGTILAQEPTTCAVDGMPRAVIDAGLANEVVPLDEIGAALARLAR